MVSQTNAAPERRVNTGSQYLPRYLVWELTLKCDHRCLHCGSYAAKPRDKELKTPELLRIADQVIAAGTTDIVLIGGEAYLHAGFLELARKLVQAGIRVSLTTGGAGITKELALQMKKAGFLSASVSIDGLANSHNKIRNSFNSFERAMNALDNFSAAGLTVTANTNINRYNHNDLESLYELLKNRGVQSWQLQLTIPLGRAIENSEMLLQPYDLIDIIPRIAELKKQGFNDGVLIMPGNNLGYFGPEEGLLRSQTEDATDYWQGCLAGRYIAGIESNGNLKGCPSLQPSFNAGNLQKQSFQSIWQNDMNKLISFTRHRTTSDLWGFCAECSYAAVCQGGCSFTSYSFFGKIGNNPYCHHRAIHHKNNGYKEVLKLVEKPGDHKNTGPEDLPFSSGRFKIQLEPF